MTNQERPVAKDEPKNPLADTPEEKLGTHPLGATVGAVGGAVAGAIGGLAAGPVGSLAGAVGGAVLGGALGASSGTTQGPVLDTSAEEAYWREHYPSRPYATSGGRYEDYAPAYRYGAQAYAATDRPREWDEVESELASGWEAAKGDSTLSWDSVKHAVRDAWAKMRDGIDRSTPGDADGDR